MRGTKSSWTSWHGSFPCPRLRRLRSGYIPSRRIHLIVFAVDYKKFRNLTKPPHESQPCALCGAAAVAGNISSSCCTAGDRGPPKPRPRRQPIFSPPSSKLLRADAIPGLALHQLYLPQTRSYLSRLPASANSERATYGRAAFDHSSGLLFAGCFSSFDDRSFWLRLWYWCLQQKGRCFRENVWKGLSIQCRIEVKELFSYLDKEDSGTVAWGNSEGL